MREILFRGKWKNNGKWVYGCYIKEGRAEYIYVEGETVFDTGRAEVIPETLGQYTGLKDKNGVKIFKGDVVKALVKCGLNRNGSHKLGDAVTNVFFDELTAAFSLHWHSLYSPCSMYKNSKKYEVIGNIHDTPELLSQEKEG